ncbi:MAG: ABC transporter ATP-binding protein [Acidobacteria bacterium]|nr:MAG: ABC transporter ATP-binding protein [Acidobacteriota bacterium]
MWSHVAPIVPYLRPYRRRFAAGILCVAVTAGVGLLAPLIIGRAIDALRAEVTGRLLLVYAGLLVGIHLVKGVAQFAQRKILVTVSRDVERDLRDDLFAHLTRLEPAFFQRHEVGDLMARATNDLEAVRLMCGPSVMYAANTVLTSIGCLAFMAAISLEMTLLVLLTMPFVAIVTRLFGQRTHDLFKRVQESFAGLSSKVQENIAGGRVVRAYARERRELADFERLSDAYVEHNRQLIRWNAAFSPLLHLTIGIGFAIALFYGGRLMLDQRITIGEFVTFNLFLGRMSWPMIAVGWVINLVTRGAASLGRIHEVLATEPKIRDRPPLIHPPRLDGAIACHALRFAYGDAPPVLDRIEVAIAAGETIGLVGRTGAGKSTFLSLIPRLLEPPPGSLTIDGHDVHRLPLDELRQAIGMVPQETFLFSASLRDNIAFGRPDATEDAVREVAFLAGLERDLARFPRGLDTLVGERGVTLSGGQKQRVALARAILRDPRILLLDDCLSAVDAETEVAILKNLRAIFPGRTVILASHRISAVQLCDRVLVLDGGRICEEGCHDDLLAAGGLYAELNRRQQLEEALAAV